MKKYFMKRAPKELTEEENREFLAESNIPTHKGTRKTKFSGFSDYAKNVAAGNKKDYNSQGVASSADSIYARQQEQLHGPGGNPYAQARAERAQGSGGNGGNPYANQASGGSSNPYSTDSSHNASARGNNPYDYSQNDSSGGNGESRYGDSDPYSHPIGRTVTQDTEYARDELFRGAHTQSHRNYEPSVQATIELNEAPSDFGQRGGGSSKNRFDFEGDGEQDELNERPSDLAPAGASKSSGRAWQNYDDEVQEQMNSEDEETEALKQQIRFTKKESVQSTRNALRAAAEAEASGRNAIGMLGSQGERIANTERSLALAENQTRIAEEKARELARLNRSIFVPNVGNPFTSKRRLQEKEAKIKSEHLQEQLMREKRRQAASESEGRVLDGLNGNKYSETALRHKREMMKGSEARRKYQFEADSEDEDLENEIDLNLEGLDQASQRLQHLGAAMREEVDSQNNRLDRITDQTDRLDIDVHLNAARMASLK